MQNADEAFVHVFTENEIVVFQHSYIISVWRKNWSKKHKSSLFVKRLTLFSRKNWLDRVFKKQFHDFTKK